MSGNDSRCAKSRDRPQACPDNGQFREHGDDMVPRRIRRNIRSLHLLESLDAATSSGSVDEADDRYSLLAREHFPVSGLVADCAVRRSASYREIISTDDDTAAIYLSC